MKKIFFAVVFTLIASTGFSQVAKGTGIFYFNGPPTIPVNECYDGEVGIDTSSGYWYEFSRDLSSWIKAGFRVQLYDTCARPVYTPVDKQSEVVLNSCDSLYRWRSGAWYHLNPGSTVTGWTIAADDADTELITNQTVTFSGAGITTTDYNPATDVLLITSTEVDGSVTNELQTLANTSDATSHTVTLSNSGGSVQLVEGANVTLTTTGTGSDGIVTIAASSGGGTDLSYSGASSPVTLNSSTGTDVTFTQGGIVTITATSSNLTISATEVDGSVTNEAWTIDADDADTEVISNQTVKFEGAGITTTDYNPATDVLLITSTEVDGSVTNELQTLANTSDATSHTVTLSNSGGSVQLVEGSNVTLTTTGTGSDGIVTIASTEVDGSITNEGILGVGAGGATSSTLTTNTSTGNPVTINVAGILSIGETTSSNGGSITITGTEVDGSVTNELQTLANTSDATSHTVTLSNSGGSVQLVEGSNITLTTTGTGSDGIVTIAAASAPGTDLSFTGASSPVTLNSSTGTDVTFTQGGIVTITATSSNLTISATEVDGSVTNEAWTIDADDADTEVISNQTVKFQGAGITTTDYNPATDVLLITSTEVDGSVTNELQTLANTSNATSHTVTLSNSGGSVQLVEGSNITLTTTGTGSDGIVTIASTEVDGSVTNEGILGVGAGGATSSTLTTNTSTGNPVTINVAGILSISETTSSNGGSITITGTEVDGSVTNELQTLANTSDATSHTVTLSNSGGSVQLVEGSNITLTTSGTGSDGIVTIAAASAPGTDLSFTGASSPVTLNSSTGTDVTFTQGGIVTITATSSNITISATEVDGSVTNELQTLANTSNATSHTVTLSNSGGSVQLVEGSNVTLTTTGTGSDGIVTIAATEVDGSITNEGILGVGAGGATSSTLTSNTSGANDVTVNVAGILSISETTSSNGGSITITGTEVDGSVTNEAWTIDADDVDTEVISNQTVKFEGAGITTTDYNPATNVLLITSTEVDGSVTNELQTIANTSNATSHTVTLSNSGGSIQLVEGSNITLTTTGTGSDGIVTIASTAGGTDLSFTGASSPVTLNSSTGTDVTFTQGGIVTITGTSSNLTISATEVDGSVTNELQTLTNTSNATSHTVTLSNSGGSVQLVEGSNITLTTTGTGSDGIVTIASTAGGITAADNGLTLSGSTVKLGGPLTQAGTSIEIGTNEVFRWYGEGKWSVSSWTGFGIDPRNSKAGISGLEGSPTTNSTPTIDAALELNPNNSAGTIQSNSLAFGGYTTDADGFWIQSRSGSVPNFEYPLSLQPRGGQMSVGRLTNLSSLVTFTGVGLTGSTAAGSVLLLENSEGNGKTSLIMGSGSNNVTGELAMFHATDAFRITNRNGTNGTSSVRVALGGETSDVASFQKSAATTLVKFGVGTTAPGSTLQSAGSFGTAYLETVGAPTFDETKRTVIYTASTNISWTLPTAAACNCQGREYILHHSGSGGTITLSQSVSKGNTGNFNTLTAGEWAYIIYGASSIRGYKLTSN